MLCTVHLSSSLGNNYIIENSRIVDDRCTICNQKLQSEELTSDDFALMRRQVLHHLIKGDDVFRNSNPAEMQSFLRFVERNKPFELALDALNLAFAGVGRRMLSKDRPNRLVNIVRNLKKNFRAKKPCVVVRKHFFRDSETDLEQINKLAHVYLLDDKTSDDPFILYAALSSGQSCYVISNDTYAFLNETLDLKTRSLFLRWRRTRLIGNFYVTLEGVPKITIFCPLSTIGRSFPSTINQPKRFYAAAAVKIGCRIALFVALYTKKLSFPAESGLAERFKLSTSRSAVKDKYATKT
uniref:PRORP domain-containing protein n=1 Tax=Romanomermis culicivorax TaxID=13658 RepID=A0A915HNI8_ROMCU